MTTYTLDQHQKDTLKLAYMTAMFRQVKHHGVSADDLNALYVALLNTTSPAFQQALMSAGNEDADHDTLAGIVHDAYHMHLSNCRADGWFHFGNPDLNATVHEERYALSDRYDAHLVSEDAGVRRIWHIVLCQR